MALESSVGERSLDDRVAELVFGWKWVTNPAYRGRWLMPPEAALEGQQRGAFEIVHAIRHMQKPVMANPEGSPKVPPFSSDLKVAWGLVEHIANSPTLLDENGLPVRLRFATLLEKADFWNCSAEGAARAVCMATLQLIG